MVRLWRPDGGAAVAALAGHRAPVNEVAFSPDGDDGPLGQRRLDRPRSGATAGVAGSFPEESRRRRCQTSSSRRSAPTAATRLSSVLSRRAPTVAHTVDVEHRGGAWRVRAGRRTTPRAGRQRGRRADPDDVVRRDDPDPTDVGRRSRGRGAGHRRLRRRVRRVGQPRPGRGRLRTPAIFDTPARRSFAELVGHDPARRCSAPPSAPTSDRALTASVDGTARVWDAGSGEQLLSVDGVPSTAAACTSSARRWRSAPTVGCSRRRPATRTTLTCGTPTRGEHLVTLEGVQGGGVTDLAFSADGRFLVTASSSDPSRLWDGHSGRLLAPVADSVSSAGAVAFTSDQQAHRARGRRGRRDLGGRPRLLGVRRPGLPRRAREDASHARSSPEREGDLPHRP